MFYLLGFTWLVLFHFWNWKENSSNTTDYQWMRALTHEHDKRLQRECVDDKDVWLGRSSKITYNVISKSNGLGFYSEIILRKLTLIYPAHFEDVPCQSGVNHIYEG